MASAAGLSLPRSPISSRLTLSPRASRDTLAVSASPPPSPASSSRSPLSARAGTNRTGNKPRSSSKDSKENIPLSKRSGDMSNLAYEQPLTRSKAAVNGDALGKEMGNGGGRVWRDGSVEDSATDLRARKAGTGGPSSSKARTSKSPTPSVHSPYNGLPTLPTVFDNDQESEGPGSPESPGLTGTPSRPPPPAASTMTAQGKPVTRKRRSSSIVRKPSPGAVPTKAVDWEIPRKTLHSSIGFLTYFLWYMDPPSLRPLITVLTIGLVSVLSVDVLRLNIPAFAEVWESYLGFLMRESERNQINGVVYYLVGVIFVLAAYPRDVAVVSILTLSWSDTTASTIGRLWGRYTRPLPPHVPGIKLLPFAPRKSLAGFLAATVTGFLICMGSWRNGSEGRWHILEGHWLGLVLTSVVVGVGGAVVEALDLGLDDNLTLPILSGAIMWLWFTVTNVLL